MCHFLKTNSKMRMIWAHKRVTTLKLGTAEAFVEKNMQLWTNGIETATPAKNRRFPPNSLIAFFDNFQSSEVNFFFKIISSVLLLVILKNFIPLKFLWFLVLVTKSVTSASNLWKVTANGWYLSRSVFFLLLLFSVQIPHKPYTI